MKIKIPHQLRVIAVLSAPVLLVLVLILAVRSTSRPIPEPVLLPGSNTTFSTTYQGVMEGYTRRLQLKNLVEAEDRIEFVYSIIGSTSEDRNKRGFIDTKSGTAELESLGVGAYKKTDKETSLSFEGGSIIFIAIN